MKTTEDLHQYLLKTEVKKVEAKDILFCESFGVDGVSGVMVASEWCDKHYINTGVRISKVLILELFSAISKGLYNEGLIEGEFFSASGKNDLAEKIAVSFNKTYSPA
ncbi:hypothetical protein OTK49_21180 [Vibrio coralliirubri]|uniref:hypothetical protein n=1 Tax=Vibrio coralliirubri TaxID=1516159 RepID=UPI00228488B9|nr:hypothetical protein [Vibrio coralliirubri]MCY9865034.1 hypothetical protein [Vibrio coralliirubri]